MTKQERLRKLYGTKLGESLVSKLSDAQIKILSNYYNSLDNTSDSDSQIFQGRNDTKLHDAFLLPQVDGEFCTTECLRLTVTTKMKIRIVSYDFTFP